MLTPFRDDVAATWLDAYRGGVRYPEEKLDSFLNLYKKVKRKRTAEFLGARRFTPQGTQGRKIKLLCRLPDQFAHFQPLSWSLEATGLPGMCRDLLDFIESLSCDYRMLSLARRQDIAEPVFGSILRARQGRRVPVILVPVLVCTSVILGLAWIVSEFKSGAAMRVTLGLSLAISTTSAMWALKDLACRVHDFWVSTALREVSAQVKAGNGDNAHAAIERYLKKVQHDPSSTAAVELINELNPKFGTPAGTPAP